MRIDGTYSDVSIRDISSRGMMLQAASPPRPGTYIEILRAAHIVVARVVWASERRFGIRTSDRIDIAAIADAAALSGARLPDQERRSSERPRPSPLNANSIAQQAERNRRRSRAFEFGAFAVCGIIAASLLSSLAYDVLAAPFRHVTAHLVGSD